MSRDPCRLLVRTEVWLVLKVTWVEGQKQSMGSREQGVK